MLSLLLSLALQDDILGWRCSAERSVDGHTYRLSQSIEGGHRYPRNLEVKWLAGPFEVVRSLDWIDIDEWPPEAPRLITFLVPVAARASRPMLRITFADGTGQVLTYQPPRWYLNPTRDHAVSFSSTDRGLNRQLWAARSFHAVVEDRRGRALGSLDVGFPESAEAVRLAAELAGEVDLKLADAANPANQCSPYGAEAYVDPA